MDKVFNNANTLINGQQQAGAALELSVGELKTQMDASILPMRRVMEGSRSKLDVFTACMAGVDE